MILTAHVACMGEKRSACRIVIEKLNGRIILKWILNMIGKYRLDSLGSR
jgi:hypothetical protein